MPKKHGWTHNASLLFFCRKQLRYLACTHSIHFVLNSRIYYPMDNSNIMRNIINRFMPVWRNDVKHFLNILVPVWWPSRSLITTLLHDHPKISDVIQILLSWAKVPEIPNTENLLFQYENYQFPILYIGWKTFSILISVFILKTFTHVLLLNKLNPAFGLFRNSFVSVGVISALTQNLINADCAVLCLRFFFFCCFFLC